MHAQQAFFYKNPTGNPWWQIVHVNPRSRRLFDTTFSTERENTPHTTMTSTEPDNTPDTTMTSISHGQGDTILRIREANLISQTNVTPPSTDDEGDDLGKDLSDDLLEADIEQISESTSNNAPLPDGLGICLTEMELQEAMADNDEVFLEIDIFGEA